jgi:Fe2+-dicitrate sensor, membrane component
MGIEYPDKELAIIILKSAYASLTQEEQDKLSAWLNASEANQAKYRELIDSEQLRQKMAHYARRNENEALHFQTILQSVNKKTRVYPIHFFRKYRWAVAIIVFMAAGAWWLTRNNVQKNSLAVTNEPPKPIVPGTTGAILILDDGSQLVLDSMGNGIVATQEGAQIQLKDGQLAYDETNAGKENLVYNTLATPKGREFKIVLPDGTNAWLNSGSSIRYPIHFHSKERLVYITGEVYFEVAHNKSAPFLVKINTPAGDAGTVEVLGTHFNINAYENVYRTTLLEGSVKVRTATDRELLLRPNQQAIATPTSLSIDRSPDIDKVMAWRRGFFNFDNVGLQEVMQQLARWYDIEVAYQGAVPDITFAGELSRGMTWSGVLRALEESKVHFKTEGRKIIILP